MAGKLKSAVVVLRVPQPMLDTIDRLARAGFVTGTCGQSQHYQTEMGSPRDRFGATVGIELGENRSDMELGGVKRDS